MDCPSPTFCSAVRGVPGGRNGGEKLVTGAAKAPVTGKIEVYFITTNFFIAVNLPAVIL